ncbi:class I SAM-dependent methyltransferase [bacterium]|nr:class I SAM-dependent methyltransferase [bacterium]
MSYRGDKIERCKNALELNNGNIKINPEKIQYISNMPFEKIDIITEKSCDIIYSFDVLEHVLNVRECFRQMKRFLKPQGYCIHEVDLAGHGEFDDPYHPLDFLRFSPFVWRLMNSNRGAPNRVRFGEYMTIMKEMNFKTVKLIKNKIHDEEVEKVKPFLFHEFNKLNVEELSVTGFFIVAQTL